MEDDVTVPALGLSGFMGSSVVWLFIFVSSLRVCLLPILRFGHLSACLFLRGMLFLISSSLIFGLVVMWFTMYIVYIMVYGFCGCYSVLPFGFDLWSDLFLNISLIFCFVGSESFTFDS